MRNLANYMTWSKYYDCKHHAEDRAYRHLGRARRSSGARVEKRLEGPDLLAAAERRDQIEGAEGGPGRRRRWRGRRGPLSGENMVSWIIWWRICSISWNRLGLWGLKASVRVLKRSKAKLGGRWGEKARSWPLISPLVSAGSGEDGLVLERGACSSVPAEQWG